MQARILSAAAAVAILAATSAFAQQSVQTQPAEASHDFFLKLNGIEGESSPQPPPPPPPPPPPQNAPSAAPGVQAQSGDALTDGLMLIRSMATLEEETEAQPPQAANVEAPQTPQAGLLLPAIQQVRAPAARPRAAAQTDGLLIVRNSAEAAPNDPEMPVCGHCGADVAEETAPAPQQRPRRRFSLSIGGVTLSSDGGVSVAVGDVDGDGRESGRQHAPVRPVRESAGSARPN